MNSKRSRLAVLLTTIIALSTVTLITSTSAHAVSTFYPVNWYAPGDTSYAVAMPTHAPDGSGGRFEVQPADSNHNTTETWAAVYPDGGTQHVARLILKAWYSAGLGYYWFYVHCDANAYHGPFDGNTIIGRGSFIPDYQRPYVGIFYQPDGNVVMYKYAKDNAGNRTDSWVIGALYTQPGDGTTFLNGYGNFARGSYLSSSGC